MRKFISGGLVLVLGLGMAACGKVPAQNASSGVGPVVETVTPPKPKEQLTIEALDAQLAALAGSVAYTREHRELYKNFCVVDVVTMVQFHASGYVIERTCTFSENVYQYQFGNPGTQGWKLEQNSTDTVKANAELRSQSSGFYEAGGGANEGVKTLDLDSRSCEETVKCEIPASLAEGAISIRDMGDRIIIQGGKELLVLDKQENEQHR